MKEAEWRGQLRLGWLLAAIGDRYDNKLVSGDSFVHLGDGGGKEKIGTEKIWILSFEDT